MTTTNEGEQRAQMTTITVSVPVGRDHPLVAAIADLALDAADERGFDAVVSSETTTNEDDDTCEHDWLDRDPDADPWQECHLCGEQRNGPASARGTVRDIVRTAPNIAWDRSKPVGFRLVLDPTYDGTYREAVLSEEIELLREAIRTAEESTA